jgi:acylphosphatase
MSEARCDITFRGRVQGVGFRYTTVRIAAKYRVTGWVRNEPDGSVRCVVEGGREEIDRFIAALEDAMAGNIRDKVLDLLPAVGEFEAFEIRR